MLDDKVLAVLLMCISAIVDTCFRLIVYGVSG
jgi:hypothetical protein